MQVTPDILVDTVSVLAAQHPGGLVPATDVVKACSDRGIVCGHNGFRLHDADLTEAAGAHRLLRFKRGLHRNAQVFLALRGESDSAPTRDRSHPARTHADRWGWVECTWAEDLRRWRNADRRP